MMLKGNKQIETDVGQNPSIKMVVMDLSQREIEWM